MRLTDVELHGFAWLRGHAEAVQRGGGLDGFGIGGELPAVLHRVLEDDGSGVGSGVVDSVGDVARLLYRLHQVAVMHGDVVEMAGEVLALTADVDGLID